MKIIKKIWIWLFSLGERERPVKDAAEKLQMSMRVTAKCRYNAAVRLQRQGKLAFESNVLSMMQIFLAVAVLVYSVVIGTARYEVRAETLTECGDKLKELIRAIDKDREVNEKFSDEELTTYQDRYSDIVTDTENHTRSDYGLATLEMDRDYFCTGLYRLRLYIRSHFNRLIPFVLPIVLLVTEVTFITDMMGATSVLPKYLNGTAVEQVTNMALNLRGDVY